MESSDETMALLRDAVRLLRVIARPQIAELAARFESNMLTSGRRKAMWQAMDGSRTLADIATAAGVSGEAVRQFVREIEASYPDLVHVDERGPLRPRRILI